MKKINLMAASCQRDITPSLPVALTGQYYSRVATEVFSRLTANIVALESSFEEKSDLLVFVSCDLIGIPAKFVKKIREETSKLLPGFETEKIIVNAIHTHTGPLVYSDMGSNLWGPDFDYEVTIPGEQNPDLYADTAAKKIADGIIEAYGKMVPVKMATGFDYLSLSYNRRVVYEDGHAEMYGSTARPDFKNIEGPTDSGIHFMAFENEENKLIAALINVPCPSQILEHHSFVSSDFWHNVRENLNKKYGDQLVVVALCGAAGDLSPRDLVRTAMDEPLMHKTKMYNNEGAVYIADKIARAFEDFYKNSEMSYEATLKHITKIHLTPVYSVTKEDMEESKIKYAALRAKHKNMSEFTEAECMYLSIYAGCVKRYELQQKISKYPIELHCIKIGDATIATNPFEFYLYYADKIRSKAKNPNTFIVQLACGYEGYLATETAIKHGGYSTYPCNGLIGPEGGEELVKVTAQMLESI